MKDSLSIQQARKLVLHAQQLPSIKQKGRAIDATLTAIEHLGYIQIDTLSVIQRAHHHTLWNRNPRYKPTHLDQLIEDKKVFEYWSHAAAYLPFKDYRFSLPRQHDLKIGKQKHWYKRDEKLMRHILKRIDNEGPLMAKDFEHSGSKTGEWKSKPAKRALEYLFMQGDLMIPKRVNFHKVYELTEKVLPEGQNTTLPSQEDHARFLITRYLKANGLGQAEEIAYLLKGIKPLIQTTLQDMLTSNELIQIQVNEHNYYALNNALDSLDKPLARRKLKILSPFDNLVIQRKRIKALFEFDYLIECYVPEAKRQYGYFSLPILWDSQLVARMDCKADRKTSVLHIQHFALEPNVKNSDALFHAFEQELESFLNFNNCHRVVLYKTTPMTIKTKLLETIDHLNTSIES